MQIPRSLTMYTTFACIESLITSSNADELHLHPKLKFVTSILSAFLVTYAIALITEDMEPSHFPVIGFSSSTLIDQSFAPGAIPTTPNELRLAAIMPET